MQPVRRLYIRGMKIWGMVPAVAALIASSVTACNSGSTATKGSVAETSPAAATTTTTSTAVPAVDPTEREYHDATELGADLTAHGVRCDVEPTGQSVVSTFGRCTLPVAGDPAGVPIAITVWSTPAKATAGILAVTDHARAISDASGRTFYYLTGANWLIDFDSQRRAPEQVKEAFGGTIQKIG